MSRQRDEQLMKRYGIDHAEFLRMEEAQGGVCKICHKPPSYGYLHVDHDHNTGEVRGLLCRSCNLGLGMFKDCALKLYHAMQYLTKGK